MARARKLTVFCGRGRLTYTCGWAEAVARIVYCYRNMTGPKGFVWRPANSRDGNGGQ